MPQDIKLTEDFDLLFQDGDLVIGETTRQHQNILLIVEKGELREFPLRGAGLRSWLLEERVGNLNSEIKQQFEADGMRVLRVQANGANIQTEAIYE